ncbi:hypothetical protein EV649_7238 [Kribbella sp. VKM Ac-2569]|uniref:hypothetical protein n=1 Tax=Kribbella sp. VKM Ac-2569 TaxID=2512220 RepID=UPI00102C737A|nr:hypothetical protein [Kribbella sp. VKM Ac-2569]RZT12869.1 hypothetical protein EV649_7238 [Kribbella sp. VKM Ac-2569]
MPVRFLTALLAAVAFLPALPARAQAPELPDRIAVAWRTDHLSVDPRLAIPATELDRIRGAMRTAGVPVYVALVPRTPYLAKNRFDLPTLLHARIGEPGLYLVATVDDKSWATNAGLYRQGGLRGRDLTSVRGDDKQRFDIVSDRPAPQIVRTIQHASTAYDGRALPAVPAADLEPERHRGLSVTDKSDRAAYVGLGVGGFLGLVLTLMIALRRRGKPGRSGTSQRAVEPRKVQLKADGKIKQAERAFGRLDRRRNKTTKLLDQRDDAYRRLDAARTLRADQPDDVLASAGALVLARQAERIASGAALQPPCFFNPTHNPGTAKVDWSDDVEVPACEWCASVVRRGDTPPGLLVPAKSGLLGHDRKPVPYWTLDPEDSPMVATGFGALSDDLADRITGRKEDAR